MAVFGKGIGAIETEVARALSQLMGYLFKGFSGFDRAKKYKGHAGFKEQEENEVVWHDVFPLYLPNLIVSEIATPSSASGLIRLRN